MSENAGCRSNTPGVSRSWLQVVLASGTRRSPGTPSTIQRGGCKIDNVALTEWLGMSLERRIADMEQCATDGRGTALSPDEVWSTAQAFAAKLATTTDEERRAVQIDLRLLSACYRSRLALRINRRGGHLDLRVAAAVTSIQRESDQSGLTLKSIAAGLRISPRHLGRLFSAETGLPFHQYLRIYRLIKSADLLHSFTLSIKEISAAIGYTTPTNFSRDFACATGVSPTTYRSLVSAITLGQTRADGC